jgi:hypothetical protein
MEEYRLDEKIQDFLNGDLEESEKKELAEELSNSPEKLEAFRFDKGLHQVLQHRELFEVRDLVRQSIERTGPTNPRKRNFRPPRNGWLLLFGSLVIIALGIWGFGHYQRAQQRTLAQQLSESYLSPLENVLLIDAETEPVLSRGMQAYSQGAYTDAIVDLDNYFSRTADWNAGLYLGIALLLEQQVAESEVILQQVVEQGDHISSLEARWYLSLALLKQGEIEQAKSQLLLLSQEESPETENAKSLLQEIQ